MNIGDIYQFPNGKFQYKVVGIEEDGFLEEGVYLEKNINGVWEDWTTKVDKNSPFLRKQNKVYDHEAGEWFLRSGQ